MKDNNGDKMRKLNSKGFTLIEVIAVVVIIGLFGMIAIPSVLSTIATSREKSYDILVQDIKTAGIQLIDELEYAKSELYHYNTKPVPNENKEGLIKISNDSGKKVVVVSLQTLVSNGFLTGSNNDDTSKNGNKKVIYNPLDKSDIGSCEITITKEIDADYSVSYSFVNSSDENMKNCPTTDDLE